MTTLPPAPIWRDDVTGLSVWVDRGLVEITAGGHFSIRRPAAELAHIPGALAVALTAATVWADRWDPTTNTYRDERPVGAPASVSPLTLARIESEEMAARLRREEIRLADARSRQRRSTASRLARLTAVRIVSGALRRLGGQVDLLEALTAAGDVEGARPVTWVILNGALFDATGHDMEALASLPPGQQRAALSAAGEYLTGWIEQDQMAGAL